MSNKEMEAKAADSKEQAKKKQYNKDIDAQRDPDKNDPPARK